jgi:hypothetical protein
MTLRESGLVHENRGTNGQMIYRVQTVNQMFQYTSPKIQNSESLEHARAHACVDLERQLGEAGFTLADVIRSTDPRGVALK